MNESKNKSLIYDTLHGTCTLSNMHLQTITWSMVCKRRGKKGMSFSLHCLPCSLHIISFSLAFPTDGIANSLRLSYSPCGGMWVPWVAFIAGHTMDCAHKYCAHKWCYVMPLHGTCTCESLDWHSLLMALFLQVVVCKALGWNLHMWVPWVAFIADNTI